jgi:hypothetical protein
MLKANDLINGITDDLARLETAIRNRGLLQRLDLHKSAETFFSGLLNRLYAHDLQNLNFVKPNHPAIDLGDKSASLGIQITSQNQKAKVQHTLDTAFKHEVFKSFAHVKVFIIGEKAGSYSGITVPSGITFDPAKDVFDIRDVLKHLETLDVTRLGEIAEYLSAQLVSLNDRLLQAGPTVQSHDRDMFYEADLCLGEKTLTAFLDWLASNHSYSTEYGGEDMWNIVHHFRVESNRFIDGGLNEEADKLSQAVDQLMGFLALNCFHMRGNKSRDLYLRPDWHDDRGGDGSIEQYKKYTKAEDEMLALIGSVREAYRSYRRKVKTTLMV